MVTDEAEGLVQARREQPAPVRLEVLGRMEGDALVEGRALRVQAEEASLGQTGVVVRGEALEVSDLGRRDRRGDQKPSGPQDPEQLFQPGELLLLGVVREDRDRVDDVEGVGRKRERRLRPHRCESPRQYAGRPVDELRVHIDPVEAPDLGEWRDVAGEASASAAEVEPCRIRAGLGASPREGVADLAAPHLAHGSKHAPGALADPRAQGRGRHRPAERARRDERDEVDGQVAQSLRRLIGKASEQTAIARWDDGAGEAGDPRFRTHPPDSTGGRKPV